MRKYVPSAYMVDTETDEPVFSGLCEYVRADDPIIAAAPDLLAACQAMAHDIRAIQLTDGEHRLSEDAARQMLQFLERVISKATEGTNGKERSLD